VLATMLGVAAERSEAGPGASLVAKVLAGEPSLVV